MVNAVTEAYFKLRDQSDAERNQTVIDLLGQEMDKRSKEVLRLRDNLRTLAKEATGKDPFRGQDGGGLAPEAPAGRSGGPTDRGPGGTTVLEARIKAAEEEVERNEGERGRRAAKTTTGQSTTQFSAGDRLPRCDGRQDHRRQRRKCRSRRRTIAAKQAKLKEIEEKSARGKDDPLCVQLAKEIASDEQALEQTRERDEAAEARHEAELAIVARRGGGGNRAGRPADGRTGQDAIRLGRPAACLEQMLQGALRRATQERRTEQRRHDGAVVQARRIGPGREGVRVDRAAGVATPDGAGRPARVTLMQAAEPPCQPVELFPYRNHALAVLAVSVLPFGLAVFWERLAGRVGDSQSFEQQSTAGRSGRDHALADAHARAPAIGRGPRSGYEIRLFEESIDSLRTSLSLSEDLSGMRVLAVTSAANHEGKTSVAAQLAVSFARATGEPLLLIDGDMRSPDVHSVFQIPLEPGLAKVLGGECSLEDAIVTSWSDHVHLLPGGETEQQSAQAAGQRDVEIADGGDSRPLSIRGDRHPARVGRQPKRWCWRRRPMPRWCA